MWGRATEEEGCDDDEEAQEEGEEQEDPQQEEDLQQQQTVRIATMTSRHRHATRQRQRRAAPAPPPESRLHRMWTPNAHDGGGGGGGVGGGDADDDDGHHHDDDSDDDGHSFPDRAVPQMTGKCGQHILRMSILRMSVPWHVPRATGRQNARAAATQKNPCLKLKNIPCLTTRARALPLSR